MHFSSFRELADFREQYGADGSGTMPARDRRRFYGPTIEYFEALPSEVRALIVRRFGDYVERRPESVDGADVLFAEIRRARARAGARACV